jgi:tetratricopeptide (TPR) repeat protein
LATLYQDQGRYTEAEPLFQRALTISEQTLGPEHPETAVMLYNLAFLYQQRHEQAEGCYQRVLLIDEQVYGQHHPEVATDLEAYASLLREMNREQEALPLEARAKAIRDETRS